MINKKDYKDFCKVIYFLSYKALEIFKVNSDKSDRKRNVGKLEVIGGY